ncbi:phosphoadenosine phosphosulfate reductase domain-containing protein [Candidatus Lokiarchaeum ossiferum]|uniref:phosphoadenosine phosphosulfate reductase domain-containing protein n=1 Tax=Candidatus Lokiarchaeum ossiferum TaxID=2951803 RepID=UPI00352E794D
MGSRNNSARPNYPRKKRKGRMKIPYLGKVSLFWCSRCNLPLLDHHACGLCGNQGIKVKISPPGDVRPAFWKDYAILQETVNRQYGKGVGSALFSENQIVLLSRIGGLDRTDEVVLNGVVIGLLIFNIVTQMFEFQPRVAGGDLIFFLQTKLYIPKTQQIWVKEDALPFIQTGKSILAPGVSFVSPSIRKDDYVLIIKSASVEIAKSMCVAIGIAREDSALLKSMVKENYGSLAKNKAYKKNGSCFAPEFFHPFNDVSPESVMKTEALIVNKDEFLKQIFQNLKKTHEANTSGILREISKATSFISKTLNQISKPVAVAYSGGKDSLATLLLVWKVLGPNFKIFFANTGLELPEVEENVFQVAKALGMDDKLIIKDASDTFWKIVDSFGPPGRDYRYCCHSLKAQQITEIINTIYNGEKVLTFLGQRQYESLTRAQSKLVYVNSFIPLQIAATPIKTWNALLLWLFVLFDPVIHPDTLERIEVPSNQLYFEGHERLGCYLCPAANLASFNLLKSSHPQMYARWFSYLEDYALKYKLPQEWISMGLWRFKRLSPQWKNIVEEHHIQLDYAGADPSMPLHLDITKGFSPCLQSGYSMKGKFSQPIDLNILNNILPAVTKDYEFDSDLNVISISSQFKKEPYRLNLFPDGSFFLLVPNQQFSYGQFFKLITTSVLRAIYCNQCKTCISICPVKAIKLNDINIKIDTEKCTSCKNCVTHCPLFQMGKKLIDDLNMTDQG